MIEGCYFQENRPFWPDRRRSCERVAGGGRRWPQPAPI
jgi:hypothetical protein